MKWFKLFLIGLFLFPLLIFAQDTLPDLPLSLNPGDYVKTFLIFAGTVMTVTEFIKVKFLSNFFEKLKQTKPKLTSVLKRYLSWLVALVIGFIGFKFQLGIFAGIEWFGILAYLFFFILGTNAIYDWETVQFFIEKTKRFFTRAQLQK